MSEKLPGCISRFGICMMEASWSFSLGVVTFFYHYFSDTRMIRLGDTILVQ